MTPSGGPPAPDSVVLPLAQLAIDLAMRSSMLGGHSNLCPCMYYCRTAQCPACCFFLLHCVTGDPGLQAVPGHISRGPLPCPDSGSDRLQRQEAGATVAVWAAIPHPDPFAPV